MTLQMMGPNDPHRPRLVQKMVDANLERPIVDSAAMRATGTTEYRSTTEVVDMPHDWNMERREHRTETWVADGGRGRKSLKDGVNDVQKAENCTRDVYAEYGGGDM